MFIIARKHITPRRMLYRARIVLESCSYRNCNRPIRWELRSGALLVDTFGHAQADPQLIGPIFNIILMEAAAMRKLDTVNVAIYYYHRARYH